MTKSYLQWLLSRETRLMDPSSGIDSPGGLDLEGMLHSLLSFSTNICQQVHECSAECNVETPNQNFPQIKLLDISGPHCHSHRRLCPARHCSHPCSRRPRPRSSPFVSLHCQRVILWFQISTFDKVSIPTITHSPDNRDSPPSFFHSFPSTHTPEDRTNKIDFGSRLVVQNKKENYWSPP